MSHKRVKSELTDMVAELTVEPDAATTYGNIRRSLRPLRQSPNPTTPTTKQSTYRHGRSQTIDDTQYLKEKRSQLSEPRTVHFQENVPPSQEEPVEEPPPQTPPHRSTYDGPHTRTPTSQSPQIKLLHSHSHSSPDSHAALTAAFSTPEIETFKRSSTGHLRTLSKFAQSGETEDLAITNAIPSVVGLQGRRRLKRADSVAGANSRNAARRQNVSAWTAGSMLDKQRQFLQAYEYLCHIGEAKEWLEEIVQKPIPPIVELEEALRDGVTLAEVVQAMYPNRTLRIFRHPRLQYRHSDNIALFFRFLDEIEVPELFRFELIDLYEKKNLPKVIHCVHALSWLLYKKGIVDIRMGNLVGQLEFEHHELEKTQKGLDKSGVSMPSFAGMAASFGAEPEPEPAETEEDRVKRELHDNEAMIVDLQAQIRGEMLRLTLSDLMYQLWDFEDLLVDLQSTVRGNWARQIFQYRLGMQQFAVNLQAICRGSIVRSRQLNDEKWRRSQEHDVLRLQNLIRGAKARARTENLRSQMRTRAPGVQRLQAAIRGALRRKTIQGRCDETKEAEGQVRLLQAAIRGALRRDVICDQCYEMNEAEGQVSILQAAIRGALRRSAACDQYNKMSEAEGQVSILQAAIRGYLLRGRVVARSRELKSAECEIRVVQAAARGAMLRKQMDAKQSELEHTGDSVKSLQAAVRGMSTRRSVFRTNELLAQEVPTIVPIQAGARAMAIRMRHIQLNEALTATEKECALLQAVARGSAARKAHFSLLQEITRHTHSFVGIQSAIRADAVRRFLNYQRKLLIEAEPSIVNLQSIARSALLKEKLGGDLKSLREEEELILSLQSWARGGLLRKHLGADLKNLRKEEGPVISLQSWTRGALLRRDVDADLKGLQNEEELILSLQSCARGALLRDNVDADLTDLRQEEGLFVSLQSCTRAAIKRSEIDGILSELEDCEDEIIQLQALARAMVVRENVAHDLDDLDAEDEVITDLQALTRGSLVRSRFEEKRRYYRENMEKVVKAQSFVRGRIQGQAYKSLTSGKNPPVGTVKGFVHLLNDSDFDFDEEIEFERLRKVVVQQVRQNELAEQYIDQLDIKIALLVKNKITLDEVVKHQKHFGGHIGSLLPNTEISSTDPFDLKALNKASRKKLEQYQVLFFLLQTQSQYLARLFRRLRELNTSEKEYERVRHLMMGLFGYSQKRREEYYLIRLLARSSKEEIESYDSLTEYLRCRSFWNKLFASYAKSPRDRRFMRSSLGPLVRESVIDNPELDLESDPLQIHRSLIKNEELQTGRRSWRRPDVPREDAIRDPETRATFIQHLQDLRDLSDHFFSALEETLPRMPFGIRYIAQQMYQSLITKFADEDPGLILQIVGHWVWRNYFQPAIVEPEKYGAADRGLTQEQKKNLAEIAKVISQAASGRLFGTDNVYLQPLNSYIEESIQRLGQTWASSK